MRKVFIVLTVVGVTILSDPEERANLVAWLSHWSHRAAFEGAPLAIVVVALMAPWFMLWRSIQKNGTLGAIAATLALAILSNVLVGQVLISFNM